MKIKPLAVVITITAALFLSSCSQGENIGSPKQSPSSSTSQTNHSSEPAVIPTPSSKPAAYEGPHKSFGDLLLALQQAYPASNWVKSSQAKDQVNNSKVVFSSTDSCYLYGYQSFQSAVNNDFGSYGDSWSTFGTYGQFGLLMIAEDSCIAGTSKVIKYPGLGQSDSGSQVLAASTENINDCLTRLSTCFLDAGLKLPERMTSTFHKKTTELDALASANPSFCVDSNLLVAGEGATNSCEAASGIPGVKAGEYIMEVTSDLDILRMAAKSPSTQEFGKYLIYGDGWAVFIHGSTESYKKAFLEMNKVLKGTLIARY